MKFKLDENLADIGRDLLSQEGYDVSTVALQKMNGASDSELYEACRAEGRVLVTLDRDFGEVLRFPPEKTAGIIVLDCRGRLSPQAILARIEEFVSILRRMSPDGQLWIIEPGRLRIHERRESH